MYYNTTNEKDDTLNSSRTKAATQDEIIHEIFVNNAKRFLTPWDIYAMMSDSTPITSIRRAMNTLTKDKKIIKTDRMLMGAYGKKCFSWQLNAST